MPRRLPPRAVRRALLPALALLLAGALLVTGCGGDDGDDETTTESTTTAGPLSKADYISQGDEICAQGTLQIGQAAREQFGDSQPSQAQAEQFGQDEVVPSLENTLQRLRDLPVPSGDEQQVTAIYDSLEEAIKELEDNPSLFVEQGVGGAFDEANRLAKAYGFEQCGQG